MRSPRKARWGGMQIVAVESASSSGFLSPSSNSWRSVALTTAPRCGLSMPGWRAVACSNPLTDISFSALTPSVRHPVPHHLALCIARELRHLHAVGGMFAKFIRRVHRPEGRRHLCRRVQDIGRRGTGDFDPAARDPALPGADALWALRAGDGCELGWPSGAGCPSKIGLLRALAPSPLPRASISIDIKVTRHCCWAPA